MSRVVRFSNALLCAGLLLRSFRVNALHEQPQGQRSFYKRCALRPLEREAAEGNGAKSAAALLDFVVIFQSYYYFSSGVPFFQIPESLRDFTQGVAPIDDRFQLGGRDEFTQQGQIVLI